MKARAVALSLLVSGGVACGGAAPEPLLPDAHESAPPASIATATAGADLSTQEKAKSAIYDAAKTGDKDAFRKCVSKRNLAKHEKGFDEWFEIWKGAAQRGPDSFKKVILVEEDGAWKLDEN
jgi:hypothetical protein